MRWLRPNLSSSDPLILAWPVAKIQGVQEMEDEALVQELEELEEMESVLLASAVACRSCVDMEGNCCQCNQ
jgi:hypothetical protein